MKSSIDWANEWEASVYVRQPAKADLDARDIKDAMIAFIKCIQMDAHAHGMRVAAEESNHD